MFTITRWGTLIHVLNPTHHRRQFGMLLGLKGDFCLHNFQKFSVQLMNGFYFVGLMVTFAGILYINIIHDANRKG